MPSPAAVAAASRACAAASACPEWQPGDKVFVTLGNPLGTAWASRGYDGAGAALHLADTLAGHIAALLLPESWALGDRTYNGGPGAGDGVQPVDRVTRVADAARLAVAGHRPVFVSVASPRRGPDPPRSGAFHQGYSYAEGDADRVVSAMLARIISALTGPVIGSRRLPAEAIARAWKVQHK
jgi:hypothetical protein